MMAAIATISSGRGTAGRSSSANPRVATNAPACCRSFSTERRPRRLTPEEPDYYIHGGQLLADNRHLINAANVDPDSGEEIEPALIYLHDIETGAKHVIARPEKAAFMWPLVSPDDTHVLYERKDRDPSGCQLWLAAVDGSFDREILNVGDKAKVDGAWTPDGQRDRAGGRRQAASPHRPLSSARTAASIGWSTTRRAMSRTRSGCGEHRRSLSRKCEMRARRCPHLDPQDAHARNPLSQGAGTYDPIGLTAGGEWISWHYDAQTPARLLRLDKATLRPAWHLGAASNARDTRFLRARSGRGLSLEIRRWLWRSRAGSIAAQGRRAARSCWSHGGPPITTKTPSIRKFNIASPAASMC